MPVGTLYGRRHGGHNDGMDDFTERFNAILDGAMPDREASSFLTALADKGETAEEIVAAVRALRARAVSAGPFPDAVDVCGTGGDGAGSVNISTAAALVAAACGVRVAKHGNRAASSQSGSSDVLAALGLEVQAAAEGAAQDMGRFGIVFLSAPAFHPALARLAPLRKSLGRRTIFNLLGPLANPAGVERHLIGVYSPSLLPIFQAALAQLGARHAWVVHGNGLDELTVTGPSDAAILREGRTTRRVVHPQELGLSVWRAQALRGGAPAENAAALERMLNGAPGAYRDAAALNAGAALVVADRVETLRDGVFLAGEAISSGAALDLLQRLRHKQP